MKKLVLSIIVVLSFMFFAGCSLNKSLDGKDTSAGQGGGAVQTKAQTLLWSDEFNTLDRSKWNVVDKEDWGGAPGCWYAPKNVEVINGVLTIHSKQETYLAPNGYTYGWTGGKVECTYHPKYAYMEARVKHSAPNTYIWATWWTIGYENGANLWPPEFDMCEYAPQWGDWLPSQSSWWWGSTGNPTYDTRLTTCDESQWHTYGAYWSATDSMQFYVDGVISATPVTPFEQDVHAMLMMCSSSPDRDMHPDGCPLADMQVDYVRVYDVPPAQPAVPVHLAAGKPAYASTYINSAETPAKAFDGLPTSRWESQWADPQWLCVDLQANYAVNQVKIYWQYACAKDYKVQVGPSTNGPWTDCISITGQAAFEGWVTHNFTAQTGRFLRVNCTARATAWGYSIYEVQAFGNAASASSTPVAGSSSSAAGGESLAAIISATASTVAGGNTAAMSCDNNTGTRWESVNADPQWIYWDLGSNKQLSRIIIDWEVASAANYAIQGSTDAVNWTTLATVVNSSMADHNKITTSLSGSYRYVRMNGTTRTTGWGYSIWEVSIYINGGAASSSSIGIASSASSAANSSAAGPISIVAATASTVLGGNTAPMTFDKNTGTRWESAQGVDPQWIYWDLGSNKALSQIIIDWETASASNYTIQGSVDAAGWTTLATVLNSKAVDHTIITNNISGTYRYVKMNGTTRTTGWGYSIWETTIK